mgnify:CR=1 FL=1
MSDYKVKELLPTSPFPIAGRLKLDTGEETFTELSSHELLCENIRSKSIQPVSIWSLVGPLGIGRTWTMAWLGRQARFYNLNDDESEWDAALIPGLGGGANVRSIFQSIFESTEHLRDEIKQSRNSEEDFESQRVYDDPIKGYLDAALDNRSCWAVLTGNRSRFPNLDGIEETPRWTERQTQLDFLTLWFEYINDAGIDKMLILLDEFEIVATSLSKSKLVELSDGLRSFFDTLESKSDSTPNIQLILSLTTEGATNIDPAVGTQEVAGWVRPLQDRMNPPYIFETISEEEAFRILENVMEAKRIEELEEPYEPYTEEGVVRAYEASKGLPRKFAKTLNQMHQYAYQEKTISVDHAEEAIDALGLRTTE